MSLPLAKHADLAQVERLRPFVTGRACVVVGSAPLPTPQAEVQQDEVVIAVNGGISSAPRVDLWVVASRPQDRPGAPDMKPLHRTMLQQAKGRSPRHALFLRGPKPSDASEDGTLAALERLACRPQTWSVLDKPTKRWLEGELCARKVDKQPCSSGILATAIALWCEAASVRLVGISLKAGYHYLPHERHAPAWWRNHVEADRRALAALYRTYGPLLSGAILKTVAA